jgi:hypothetical protein
VLRDNGRGKAVAMNKVFHFDAPREKYHCDVAKKLPNRTI